jgi:hypothetical protein
MFKSTYAVAAAMIVALATSAPAQPQGNTPFEAITQSGKNGSFTNQGGYTTNGNVNFSDEGAMRSLNGQGGAHANGHSAVDTDGDPACPNCGTGGQGTRVEPPGTMAKGQ